MSMQVGAEQKKSFTIVSPIPRLSIPANGDKALSLNPEDIQIGSAHPSKSEKWLQIGHTHIS